MVKKFILKYFIFVNLFLVIYGKDDQELALDYFMQGQFLLNQGNYAMAAIEFQDAFYLTQMPLLSTYLLRMHIEE